MMTRREKRYRRRRHRNLARKKMEEVKPQKLQRDLELSPCQQKSRLHMNPATGGGEVAVSNLWCSCTRPKAIIPVRQIMRLYNMDLF